MLICVRCGKENPTAARFCQACGSSLASPRPTTEERKLVSVLFVDLVGSTARADRADPEDVRDTLRMYFDRVKSQIEQFDGTVEKFIGDAVVAVFGAPVSHGDDAERAVRCGLRALQAIVDLSEEHPGLDLAARAAVATGEAVVSLGPGHEVGQAIATGDVVNTAARLQAAAPPGGLIVGADTYRATRRAIRYEPLEPVIAKGKKEPVEAWLAVATLDAPSERAPSAAPMVGRDREMELLLTIWRRAVDESRAHLVTVLGPPGMGKSRLTQEFAARIEADGGQTVAGRCLPYGEQTGYGASADQLKRLAGILETDAPAVARVKLAAAVRTRLPSEEVADVTRYLSLLLGLGIDEPTDDRLLLFYAARRLVEGMAIEQPVVLAFEDVHWADPSQLDLLEYLASHVRDVPIVFLALARPELADVRPSWGTALAAQTTIPLEPLSSADAARIAADLVGTSPELAAAVNRLVDIAGGNPLFVEELAASLQEGVGDASDLPTNVLAAIASRIDLLPPEQRAVLLDASVIGKTFWRDVLRAVSDVERIDEALDALEARDFVRRLPRSQVEGDTELSFKHMLIREVAYGTLPRARRRELHAAVARHVEAAAAGHVRDLASILAHHWREAGERARAVEYLLMAAEKAREGWAKDESIGLYADALELVGDSDPSLRTRIRLLRATGLVELSDFVAGAAELDEILPELDGQDELEALIVRGRTTFWLEDTDEAFAVAKRLRLATERLGARDAEGPALLYELAAGMMRGTLERCRTLGDRALNVWVPDARPVDFALLKELHSETYYWIGEYGAAEELARSAYEMAGAIHHVERLLRGGGWRGLCLAALGRHEEALALLDSIIEQARDLGEPRWTAAPLNYSSMVFRDVYLLDEARRRNEGALELVRRHGEWGMPEMQGKIDILITDLLQGDVGKAQREWPVLWDAAITGKAWRPWLGGGRLALVRAQIAQRAEGPEATVERALDAIERARQAGRRKYEAAARTILGAALVDLGRGDEGVGELTAAVEEADRLVSPPGRWQTRAALGRALYETGDDDGAAEAYRQGAEAVRAFAETLSPEHAAALLGAPPIVEILKAH
jgi:class 3 adenylate cyclase/tetratricopeptide (TPR) repeat protein